MKKLVTIFAVLSITCMVYSCTKADEDATANYICHCEITSSSGVHPIDIPLNGKTKAEAITTCAASEDTYNSGGNTATCTLQ